MLVSSSPCAGKRVIPWLDPTNIQSVVVIYTISMYCGFKLIRKTDAKRKISNSMSLILIPLTTLESTSLGVVYRSLLKYNEIFCPD